MRLTCPRLRDGACDAAAELLSAHGLPVVPCRLNQFDCALCQKHGGPASAHNPAIVGLAAANAPTDEDRRRLLSPPPVPAVDVIVTTHNYARFLAEALQSVQSQTVAPAEIIVVDDASTDDPAAVVAQFPGVRYLRIEAHSPHAARRAGVAASRGEWVLFLDADNTLPPSFIAAALRQVQHNTAVVYPDLQDFGDRDRLRTYPEFSRLEFSRRNIVDTCALVRRAALDLSGAFDGDPPNAFQPHDYYLFQQIARQGWGFAKNPVPLNYRVHGANLGQRSGPAREAAGDFATGGVSTHEISLLLPLSGRRWCWEAQRQWLDRQTWPHDQIRLTILDTSQSAEFGDMVRDWASTCDYSDVRVIRKSVARPGLADEPRRRVGGEVTQTMCKLWNELRLCVSPSADWVWTIEDDVIPPDDALERLLHSFRPDVGAVASPYRARQTDKYIGHDLAGRPPTNPGPIVAEASCAGFGCTVFRAALFVDHLHHVPPGRRWYDHVFFEQMRAKGFRLLFDWAAESTHLNETPNGAVPVTPPAEAEPTEEPEPPDLMAAARKGVGSAFSRILKDKFGAKAHAGCSCESLKREMDREGPEWCREHSKRIVKEVLRNAEASPSRMLRLAAQTPIVAKLTIRTGLNRAIAAVESLREAK